MQPAMELCEPESQPALSRRGEVWLNLTGILDPVPLDGDINGLNLWWVPKMTSRANVVFVQIDVMSLIKRSVHLYAY